MVGTLARGIFPQPPSGNGEPLHGFCFGLLLASGWSFFGGLFSMILDPDQFFEVFLGILCPEYGLLPVWIVLFQ